jgi:zinc D-Ala-D-Ala dipeptidase
MINKQLVTPAKNPVTIAIIGCGASGVVALQYLVEYYEQLKLNQPVRIYVFEKSKTLGLGVAYATQNDEHILNMRNGTIDIFLDKPGHFTDWLRANAAKLHLSEKDTDFDSFLPRRIVGLYLKESLENSLQRAEQVGITVEFIHEEVDNFYETQEGQQLHFKDTYLDVDYTIFALGNLPSTNYPELYDAPGYFNTPWNLSDEVRYSPKPIGILGASLTAVDALISLAPTTSGQLYFMSPTGRLPKVLHIKKPFTPLFVTEENIRSMTNNFTRKLRLSEVIGLFRRELETAVAGPIDWSQIWQIDDDPLRALQVDIARAEKGENHWHTVLADTSPLLPLIWGNLREEDKKRFYREFYPLWRVYRVSMPLQNAKKVLRLLESGRLKVIRNLQSVNYDSDDKMFTATYKQDDHTEGSLRVPYLVDATGTGFNVAKSRSKLIQNMITGGFLTPHPMGGVNVNFKTLRLIKQDGKELPRAFFFGMLTKGVHFYTNALDVNAAHGQQVAKTIVSDIREHAESRPQAYLEIPLNAGQVLGWKDIPIRDGDHPDPLVPLGPLSEEAGILTTSSIYFGEHSNSPYGEETNKLEGSLLTLFARQSVARRLLAAERLLPTGHHLLVLDAYRPYRVQKSLYDFYKRKLKRKHPDMDNETLERETQKYVSLPSSDPARPSPHSTGGAVDVAIVKLDEVHEKELYQIRSRLADDNLDIAGQAGLEMRLSAIMRRHGKMLDFGTAFDHGGEKSALAYYEAKIATGEVLTDNDRRACNNRRLLFKVMTQAGFQPYFAEWWHFNAPESQMGAATAGFDYAIFGAASLNEGNRAHESMRLKVHQEALRLQREGALQAEILAAIRETGHPMLVEDWPTEIIAPPEE